MSTAIQSVKSVLSELSSDRELFEKFEISSSFTDKYGDTIHAMFDYWYDKFAQLENKIQEEAKTPNSIAFDTSLKEFVQKMFRNLYQGIEDLKVCIDKIDNFEISQLRSNIDIIENKTTIMVLFKTTNNTIPEMLTEYKHFKHNIYEIQEKCNTNFKPQHFDFRSLLLDDNVSIDCIKQDFPIYIR